MCPIALLRKVSQVWAQKRKMCLRILFSQVTEERGKIDTDIFLKKYIEQMAKFLTVEKYILKKSV